MKKQYANAATSDEIPVAITPGVFVRAYFSNH